MRLRPSSIAAAVAAALTLAQITPVCADVVPYRKPPRAIEDALSAAPLPLRTIASSGTVVAELTPLRYPPVADLARPMLRIAGLRIDPATNGIHHAASSTTLTLVRVADGHATRVALPANPHIAFFRFNADGSRFAFANATPNGTELWTGTTPDARAARVPNIMLNTVFGAPFTWMPDQQRLLVRAVARNGPAPVERVAPGPVVQETSGKSGQIVTYEDLLANPHDEALFDYYATSRLAIVDGSGAHPFGERAIYTQADPSPDGKLILTEALHHPYTYLFRYERFPTRIAVEDLHGRSVMTVADRPLQDRLPEGGVPTGPRDVAWRTNAPHALTWFEARDGGDPRTKADVRDAIVAVDIAPGNAKNAAVLATVKDRATDLAWLADDPRALVHSYDRDARVSTTSLLDPRAADGLHALWTLRDGDRYHDPGTPLTLWTRAGYVLAHQGDQLWLRGSGYSPEGTRPFLDRYDLARHTSTRVFRSELAPLETPLLPLDAAGGSVLVTRQSPSEPPNLAVRAGASERALTTFRDPAPIFQRVQRRVVRYKRPDGVDLSFTLYLPPDYKEGTPLPTFLWAYPLEYNDPSVASQNTNTTQSFVLPGGASQLFLALAGYAVLDNAAIPIVGDPKTVNDTYVEQLVAGAKAAVDEAVRLGVTDPNRVAVGGHSYGAFMTMNLLAHTRLFRAGIARSGAYNRTLTPFGFQNERRSYWEATDLYTKMSPFTYARDIHDPVLIIHGMADDNTGTFPIQSERMYAAIKGNGGTARLVMLPYEAHGYVGRESVETTLAEMVQWLDTWVKPATARAAALPATTTPGAAPTTDRSADRSTSATGRPAH